MTDVDPRAALIARIERERVFWRGLVEEVGRDRMEEPGPMGDWTFKDLAAHLLGWRERTISRLEAAGAGREPPPSAWPPELDEDDPINAWIQERSRARSVQEVLADVDRSYERLARAIAALPDDIITRTDALPWLRGESLAAQEANLFSHVHDEHLPSVRAWLATRA